MSITLNSTNGSTILFTLCFFILFLAQAVKRTWLCFVYFYQHGFGNSGARSARSIAPKLFKIVVTHQAENIWTCDRTGVLTWCQF